ncbi:hypothetical protein Q5H91_03645 [Sphingomonas sp. KR1UV-12]|uniref:Uncharacterized protein n=1 Tax=Sphingomonas aurea TaxID=3063994 RepID=A0ABT9EH51_9SPHN|nr:hypothetical protein [Sphingomonas sp. KR1UV-12]MDP1026294.1 hypothetical protein [Sphingomonas sp. KR1UV-12]
MRDWLQEFIGRITGKTYCLLGLIVLPEASHAQANSSIFLHCTYQEVANGSTSNPTSDYRVHEAGGLLFVWEEDEKRYEVVPDLNQCNVSADRIICSFRFDNHQVYLKRRLIQHKEYDFNRNTGAFAAYNSEKATDGYRNEWSKAGKCKAGRDMSAGVTRAF